MIPEDDAEAVSAVLDRTDKIRRDNDRIIEVDYRGTTIDDSALALLGKLPRLRSVVLAGTAVTDDALKSLGQIATLEKPGSARLRDQR